MKSKKIFILFTVAVLTVGISTGVYGASVAKKISAYQNAGIKVKVDGTTLDLSDSTGALDPIVYNGHSYVPAKAVAEAMGGTVTWDAASTSVIITTGAAGQDNSLPTEDESSGEVTAPKPTPKAPAPTPKSTPAPTEKPPADDKTNSSSTPGAKTANKGSITDPIKLGTSFTYTDLKNYEGSDKESVEYTFTVKKVEPISDDEIVNLGFQKPEKNALLEKVIVTVDFQVKNAKFTKGPKSTYDYQYLSLYRPYVWGINTIDGNSVIGGTDYGFDGSVDRNVQKVLSDFPKVYEGDSKSYSASGKIIMSVYKSLDNLLVLRKNDVNLEYDNSFIYFKLK